jgi:hypothetical protein
LVSSWRRGCRDDSHGREKRLSRYLILNKYNELFWKYEIFGIWCSSRNRSRFCRLIMYLRLHIESLTARSLSCLLIKYSLQFYIWKETGDGWIM